MKVTIIDVTKNNELIFNNKTNNQKIKVDAQEAKMFKKMLVKKENIKTFLYNTPKERLYI